MKKIITLLSIMLVLSLLIINVNAEIEMTVPENFIIYDIYDNDLAEIINTNVDAEKFFESKYRTEYNFRKLIDCYEVNEILYNEMSEEVYCDSSLLFPGERISVSNTGFSFLVDKSPFQSNIIRIMLQKNGIMDEILEYYIFTIYQSGYYYRFPKVMIWVQTSEQVYILGSVFDYGAGESEHQFTDYSDDLFIGFVYDNVPYGFKAYTIEEVREEFLPRNFDIRIDGIIQNRDENIQLVEDRGYVPLLSLADKLGLEVKIDYDAEKASIRFKNDEKIVYIGDNIFSDLSEFDEYDIISLSSILIDNNIYISLYDFNKIASYAGYNLMINESERIIDIKKFISVYLNNKQIDFDTNPIIESDRTLVPMRAIFEALGAEVKWYDETNTAAAVKDDVTVSVTIDGDTMLKNGESITLDVPARLIDDSRTFIPLRVVSEAFGCTVNWSEELQRVDILSDE